MFVVFFEVPSFAFSQLLPRFEARNSSIKMWVSKPIKIKRAEEAAKIVQRRHNKTLGGHSLTTFTRGGGYSKVSIIRPGRSRLLEFENKIVLVV